MTAFYEAIKEANVRGSYLAAIRNRGKDVLIKDLESAIEMMIEALGENQNLVAENVRLIALAKGWAGAVDDCYFEQYGDIYTDSIDACNEELSTIAINTDAAIAEIKALGVDEVVKFLSGLTSDECGDSAYIGTVSIAANLRAGRKGK